MKPVLGQALDRVVISPSQRAPICKEKHCCKTKRTRDHPFPFPCIITYMFSFGSLFQGYVTGGRDGVVTMWDPLFEQCLKAFKVEEASMNPGSVLLQNLPPVRALHTDEGKILIGTGNDEV